MFPAWRNTDYLNSSFMQNFQLANVMLEDKESQVVRTALRANVKKKLKKKFQVTILQRTNLSTKLLIKQDYQYKIVLTQEQVVLEKITKKMSCIARVQTLQAK